jgi:glycosyltransferase involved in cell wall biosynthesis
VSKDVAIVVPAHNEAATIVGVLHSLKSRGYDLIIVVDDGSRDGTGDLAVEEGAVVLRHMLNRGLGGALGTGIKASLSFNPNVIVTFDADGQHDPDDISPIIALIERGKADVVIGTRVGERKRIPISRRAAHRIANLVTFLLFGCRTTDSQSGLRAFSRQAAERIRITTSGMEVSSEIIAEIARNQLRLAEVPIKAIYTEYSLSKGQSFKTGLRTLKKLVLTKFRRLAS